MSDDLLIVHDGADDLEITALTVAEPRATGVQRAETISPMDLIRFAIDSKTPAAELSQLVALAEHVEERNARREFNRALAAFQHECPPLKKNKTSKIPTKGGGSFSYSYAELDVMENHIKPYLEKHGFSYTFDTDVDDKGVMLTNVCILLHENGHSRQSRFKLPIANDSAASPQQKVGIADTYAKRRALGAVLGLNITDKEQPDEEVETQPISAEQLRQLSALIDQKKAIRKNPAAMVEGFLGSFGIEELADLPAKQFAHAMATLNKIESNKPRTDA